MNRFIRIFLVLLIIMVFIGVLHISRSYNSSSNSNSQINEKTSEIIATESNNPGSQSAERRLTRADFNFLRKGQPVSYVIEKLGQNFRDVGSGFHILVYEYDKGHATLGFGSKNELTRVVFVEGETKEYFSFMTIHAFTEIYEVITNFKMVLTGQKDAKEIVSPSGLVIIRNFPSGGFGVRGKNVRNYYSLGLLPVDFIFPVKGEIAIDPAELFRGTRKRNLTNLPLTVIEGVMFEFKNLGEPPTSEVIELCAQIGIEGLLDESPRVIQLNDKEVVLTESVVINGIPLGVWAVFERIDNKYLLRAIIDLR